MTRPRFSTLLITCEHATNHVSPEYATEFRGEREVLKTHRAWDPGAEVLARDLAALFEAPAFYGEVTRLLVDLNRRETTKQVFSEFTPGDREELLTRYHRPWRANVLAAAKSLAKRGPLLHVSCHSFTSVWDGEERRVDIGLLFDPRRKLEKATADAWQSALQVALPDMRIRRNNPYRGTSDGVTTWLRKELPHDRYAGFEIELNQKFSSQPALQWKHVRQALAASVTDVLNT